MDTDLPITLTTKGLFEANDKNSQFLISKLEAWLNFKALGANWYGDESLVVNMNFTILPEHQFLDLQVDSDKNWIPINLPGLTAIYNHEMSKQSFICMIMFSNDELNVAMKDSAQVENTFQLKLAACANVLATYYHLPAI
jgi:hypothetical protein